MMRKENVNELVKALEERFPDSIVHVSEVVKNNNQIYTGITVSKKDENVSPTIYVERLISDTVEEAVEEISEVLAIPTPQVDVSNITDWKYAKDNIFARLVNFEANKEALEYMPHICIGDIAKIFSIKLFTDSTSMGSTKITNALLDIWNVSIEDLEEAAAKNEPGCNIIDIADIIADKVPFPVLRGQMFVLGIPEGLNNATMLLGADFPEKVSEFIDGDVYVIPSSIHECILVPATAGSPDDIEPLISMVNSTEVEPEDVLSDTLYRFDALKKRLSFARTEEVIYVY